MTVIIANGECPSHPYALQLLNEAETIVCCDGAVRHLEALKLSPTVIVGDGDSLTETQREKYGHLYTPDQSVEYNDLTKAFNYCSQQGMDDISVLGGCGLREDHTLANIGLLLRHAQEFRTRMITNYGIFTPIFATTTFDSTPGQQISVFSFTPDTRLTFHGLRYPVHQRAFTELWEGSLNEALTDQFTIEFCDEGKVIVYQAFNNKRNA